MLRFYWKPKSTTQLYVAISNYGGSVVLRNASWLARIWRNTTLWASPLGTVDTCLIFEAGSIFSSGSSFSVFLFVTSFSWNLCLSCLEKLHLCLKWISLNYFFLDFAIYIRRTTLFWTVYFIFLCLVRTQWHERRLVGRPVNGENPLLDNLINPRATT